MKSTFLAIIYGSLALAAQGQQPASARLVNEFANIFCTEALRAHIDTFFAELHKEPGSTGHVVASADAMIPGSSEKLIKTIEQHARFRNFPLEQLRFLSTKPGDSTHFWFWLVPKDASPPEGYPDPQPRVFRTTTLFDSSRIASVRHGHVDFGEASDEPCDW